MLEEVLCGVPAAKRATDNVARENEPNLVTCKVGAQVIVACKMNSATIVGCSGGKNRHRPRPVGLRFRIVDQAVGGVCVCLDGLIEFYQRIGAGP